MIHKLEKQDFYKVKPLLKKEAEINNISVQAVINGTNIGNIYVDNLERPQAAIIDATGTTCYFVGDAGNAVFGSSLKDCIENQLKAACLESGGSYFIATLFDEAWEKVLEQAIAHREFETDYEFSYTFNPERFRAMKEKHPILAKEYRLKKIDRDVIENDEEDTLADSLGDFWETTDEFLALGEGYCILRGNEVVSYCLSCYVDGNKHEISVETCDEEVQNQGLATIVSRAYLEQCLQRGIVPAWSTFETNTPSVKLANKLGYEFQSKWRTYEFEY
ncbi:GNAT family N-acetyltransferase [Paenibacillus elgii]